MEVTWERGAHASRVSDLFGVDLDAFLREDVLTALHANAWESVLCVEGRHAMLHVIVSTPVGTSGWRDVEPFFGYAGPVLTEECPTAFVASAWQAYSAACRERGIVAEVIRFQPDRANHLPFVDVEGLTVWQGRLISYVPVIEGDDHAQLAVYTPGCRRQIRGARRRCRVTHVDSAPLEWSSYRRLADRCLTRNRAAQRWFFDDDFFARLRRSPAVSLWGVRSDVSDELLSAAVVVSARDVAHTLFVANAAPKHLQGAHDLLTHAIVRTAQETGCRWVCLGGGRSSATDDALLRFKLKFGPGFARALPIGFAVHDVRAYAALCGQATREVPRSDLGQSAEFLAPIMPYRLASRFANPGAVSVTPAGHSEAERHAVSD
ncbi:GNAT family N-acetyltransferase [Streptomyces sp. NPDC060028]|uniref:GNAT family N-acetyltransferase n=1 Tax=Streptomyces sp. NPDC060028 TaxID=3347041 RepID=UPI003685865D